MMKTKATCAQRNWFSGVGIGHIGLLGSAAWNTALPPGNGGGDQVFKIVSGWKLGSD